MRSSHYEYLKEAAKSGQKSNFVTTANKSQKKKQQKDPGQKIVVQNDNTEEIFIPKSPEKRKQSIKPNIDVALPNLQPPPTKKGVFQSSNKNNMMESTQQNQTTYYEQYNYPDNSS